MMSGIDEPEDDQTPDTAPEQRSGGLPSRGRQAARGSVPAGFEPFTPIARAEAGASGAVEPEPETEVAPEPEPEPEPEAVEPPPVAPVAPAAAAKPTLTAAELAARRESRTGRAYSPGRQASPARPAVARETPEPAPVPEPEPEPEVAVAVPPSTRRVPPKVLMAIAACVVLIVAGAAVALRGGDDDAAPASGSATSIDAETPVSLEFQPPVRLTSNTEYVETDVLDDGNLLVTHWIRSSEPLNELSISVPSPPEAGEPPVEATDLVVAADGVRLDPPATPVSDVTSTPLPGASDLYVQYHLAGTLQRNGSTEGRALATSTSLDVEVDNDVISRMQVFPGTQVLTVACLAPGPTALPRPCGTVDEGTWTVMLEAEALRDMVIVQFDLGTAG